MTRSKRGRKNNNGGSGPPPTQRPPHPLASAVARLQGALRLGHPQSQQGRSGTVHATGSAFQSMPTPRNPRANAGSLTAVYSNITAAMQNDVGMKKMREENAMRAQRIDLGLERRENLAIGKMSMQDVNAIHRAQEEEERHKRQVRVTRSAGVEAWLSYQPEPEDEASQMDSLGGGNLYRQGPSYRPNQNTSLRPIDPNRSTSIIPHNITSIFPPHVTSYSALPSQAVSSTESLTPLPALIAEFPQIWDNADEYVQVPGAFVPAEIYAQREIMLAEMIDRLGDLLSEAVKLVERIKSFNTKSQNTVADPLVNELTDQFSSMYIDPDHQEDLIDLVKIMKNPDFKKIGVILEDTLWWSGSVGEGMEVTEEDEESSDDEMTFESETITVFAIVGKK